MKTLKKQPQAAASLPLEWFEDAWTLPLRTGKGRRGFWSGGRYPSRALGEGDCSHWGIPQAKPGPSLDSDGAIFGMTIGPIHSEMVGDLPLRPGRHHGSEARLYLRRRLAFTIVELLVVIAIIAILAGLLLPVLSKAKERGKKTATQTEINSLAAAISAYESTYSRYPAAKFSEDQASTTGGDITYGLDGARTNSEVMIILMDLDKSFNANHERNPREISFLQARVAKTGQGPGLGDDLVFRDPWGNPYVITMDLNGDNVCDDEYYATVVSMGRINAGVAVWSLGPDGAHGMINGIDTDKDNLFSWK